MSFDLYFCRKEKTDVTVEELRAWATRHEYFTENEHEGTINFAYENEDTGVYFSVGHGFPESAFGNTQEDGAKPRFKDGAYPVSVDFNINYIRPSFFAYEAMQFAADLAQSFGLLMGNPQDQRGRPENEIGVTNYVRPSTPEEGGDAPSGNGSGAERETSLLPPRFPQFEMEPRLYSSEELIEDWERDNEEGICAQVLAEEEGSELTSPCTKVASRATSMGYWRYMRKYRELTAEHQDLFVPRMCFVVRSGSNCVESAAVWPGPCGMLLPPVDNFIIAPVDRPTSFLGPIKKKKKRKEAISHLIGPGQVFEVLAPFFEDSDPIKGVKLASAEKMLADINEQDGTAFDEAQALYDSVAFKPKGAYDVLAVDQFVDVEFPHVGRD